MKQDLLRQQIGVLHSGFDRLEQVIEGQPDAEMNLNFLRDTVEKIETEIKKDSDETKYLELKSISSKLLAWAAEQAFAWGIKPSFYVAASGKISISEINRLLPIIMAALKLKIKWLAKEDPLVRYERGLFPASSLGIELSAGNDGLCITMQSDVLAMHTDFSIWEELAEMIALEEGCADKVMSPKYGQKINAYIPFKTTRLQAAILKAPGFSLALPANLVCEPIDGAGAYKIDQNSGLKSTEANYFPGPIFSYGIKIGHFKINLISSSPIRIQQIALNSAADWLQEDSWHRSLAVCPSQGKAEVITYASGLEIFQILQRDANA